MSVTLHPPLPMDQRLLRPDGPLVIAEFNRKRSMHALHPGSHTDLALLEIHIKYMTAMGLTWRGLAVAEDAMSSMWTSVLPRCDIECLKFARRKNQDEVQHRASLDIYQSMHRLQMGKHDVTTAVLPGSKLWNTADETGPQQRLVAGFGLRCRLQGCPAFAPEHRSIRCGGTAT